MPSEPICKTYSILSVFLLCLCSIIPSFVSANELFEGAITLKMTYARGVQSTNMKYYMQGNKMRTEIASGVGQNSIGIGDYENNKLYVLIPQSQSYMEMSFDAGDLEKKASQSLENVKIEESNEEKEILGYSCKKWVSTQDGHVTDIWVAKGIGRFMEPKGNLSNAAAEAWRQKIADEGGFPFLVVQKDKNGNELYRLEVTKVERSTLDSDLFQVPSDYKKLDMPKFDQTDE